MSPAFKIFAVILACAFSIGAVEAKRVPVYRVFGSADDDYMYTIDPSQRDEAVNMYGYQYQGVGFYLDNSATSGGKPFYRLFKDSPEVDHFYTNNVSERDYAMSIGYVYERDEGYLHDTQVPNSVPLYRLTRFDDTNGDVAHYYTISYSEMSYLATYLGWTYEGVQGYAFEHDQLFDSARIPILTYHSWTLVSPCLGYDTDVVALKQDLDTIYAEGATVVPIRWIIEWANGERASSSMPQMPVGITLDDSPAQDWYDLPWGNGTCPYGVKSAHSVLAAFKSAHPDLPSYSPHATAFVIASRVARSAIGLAGDEWWAPAKSEGLLDIQNHSADHDHPSVGTDDTPVWDGDLGINLAVGGQIAGTGWRGKGTFCRIGADPPYYNTATQDVSVAADFIGNVTGVRPDLFAAPQGGFSPGLADYFINHQAEHGHYAAFGDSGGFVTRGSSRWGIVRLVKGYNWLDATELGPILYGIDTAHSGRGQNVCH